ncbi:UTP--glucose-1-phosphate uridylyltransferase 3, chloroplastic-like [Chenopodium quinoa]|uniref:UTP--glucose-1-phosphate uridylyltransferase 3, chloroplastic-like n=1 Tax=Chenopodium quinoa TaxID=63459 RepID=UPI000B7967C2|nr:UTP--glucose-1-phosphate uridylyltransferase 3, chloroplastic-like [Chenopodium quinoa]
MASSLSPHTSHVATTSSHNHRSRNSLSYFTDYHHTSSTFLPFRKLNLVSLSSSHSLSSSSSSASSQLVTRVSTAPVGYATPAPEFDFEKEIARLRSLKLKLSNAGSLDRKHRVIDNDSRVSRFFNSSLSDISRVLESVELESFEMYLIKCVVAAGQEHVISYGVEEEEEEREFESSRSSLKSALFSLAEMIESWDMVGGGAGNGKMGMSKLMEEEVAALKKLLKTLAEMERFYDCIGGIIGYQLTVLELLAESVTGQTMNSSQHMKESMKCQFVEIHSPKGVDLSRNTEYASQAAIWGIEGLPYLGEIYPLGGSADRLGFVDSETGECLPAAMLPYCGRTLLEGLIRDLQAREFLYFKLYGQQCITPVAIMTSAAKNNHERICSLCEKLKWFGRGRSTFQLFEQPLVPAISAKDGEWLVSEPFTLVCKPGGHGVIWKLAYDKGVFQWFHNHGRRGATVRQVSNVVAATDSTLLALAGVGLHHKKKLGFASCQRTSGATEGINVLVEKKEISGKWAYGFSCIEYTEFDKFGIPAASSSKSTLADFPANTNILYVDLRSAEQVGSRNDESSLPGLVLNIKKQIEYVDHYGIKHSVSGGRLECTMQNIADNFCNTYPSRCYGVKEDVLDTFMVYNERRRVTSSAKKKRRLGGKSLHQTPDGALLDITRNAYDLLSYCNIKIPEVGGNENYINSGPPYLIFLHPALGPLWEVSRQKFHGGSISKGSELQIELAEFFWRDVQLDGSMIIVAENVMGTMKTDESREPLLEYGYRCARCKLQNVKVLNKGIDWEPEGNIYWRHEVHRNECLKVMLHGNAEFEATDVTLKGSHLFEVPDGYRLKVTSADPGISLQLDPIEDSKKDTGSWFWNYKMDGAHVKLEMVEL